MFTARYSVVLRSDLHPPERELLGQLCCRLKLSDGGGELLHFLCTQIDLSHHYLVQMETFRPGDVRTNPISIPHHYVSLISGADAEAPIGFLSAGQG